MAGEPGLDALLTQDAEIDTRSDRGENEPDRVRVESSTASRTDMPGVSRAVRGQSNYGIVTATSATQLVGGVEGRDLVALGEGRIVEDRLEKIVEPAAEGEDGLADVNQLRGSGPQAVHGE